MALIRRAKAAAARASDNDSDSPPGVLAAAVPRSAFGALWGGGKENAAGELNAKSSLGDAERPLGDAESSLGDAESSLGGV